jgi:hypothetical protein
MGKNLETISFEGKPEDIFLHKYYFFLKLEDKYEIINFIIKTFLDKCTTIYRLR